MKRMFNADANENTGNQELPETNQGENQGGTGTQGENQEQGTSEGQTDSLGSADNAAGPGTQEEQEGETKSYPASKGEPDTDYQKSSGNAINTRDADLQKGQQHT
jgi:hypothetical protein